MFTCWKNKKDVYMMSMCIEDNAKKVEGAGEPTKISLVADTYNQSMGGVDT